jgi:dTDP-4-amino-4,6-dideoxygalactose transaminase
MTPQDGSAAVGWSVEQAAPKWLVPLADIDVDDELVRAAADVIRSGWWTMGSKVAEFERAFADFCGAGHALAVANGTAALHLALLALGIGPGDEVVLPSLNFVAAANAIAHTGATPVFCDILGPRDVNLDPDDVAAAVGPQTRALLVLHYGGYPCRMDAVTEVAERHGLAVIEDAAHAPGGVWHGRRCGAIGRVGCFSFFSNKNLPTGEGGMIVTGDAALAERVRRLRSHGMTTLTWDRHRGHAHSYDVVARGFNYRTTEVSAALGLIELERLPGRNGARARIAGRYRAALGGVNGLTVPFPEQPGVLSAHHLAVVVLPEGASRDEVRTFLAKRGVQTSVHYPPIHRFTQYCADGARRPLPVTDALAERLLTLPLYPHMSDEQVQAVTQGLLDATAT